jgi:hypothetical protein
LTFILLLGAVLIVGCSETSVQQRQPTANDPPFGGGFPAAERPSYREPPFDPNSRRTEIRPVWRGDNGAPETRVGGIGAAAPDARITTGQPPTR